MKEENVFNTVQEPTPVEQPVAPVQPTETVQPVEQYQTPVEPQIVQQPVQDVNFNPQPPKKSPAKTILILLLTAVIIGGASFGGYKYYSSTIENKTKVFDYTIKNIIRMAYKLKYNKIVVFNSSPQIDGDGDKKHDSCENNTKYIDR